MVERKRRLFLILFLVISFVSGVVYQGVQQAPPDPPATIKQQPEVAGANTEPAIEALNKLAIKGRAPRTGYERSKFDASWDVVGACDIRNHILQRDLVDVKTTSDTDCTVLSGTLYDPYTGKTIDFKRGPGTSTQVQIDHVVALSDAWQKGAQQLSSIERHALANDPLNLLAVDGPANQQKGDGDAATWLPSNKNYRCRYIARQIAVKVKYTLWVTQAEHDAISRILASCPGQLLPIVEPA